MENTFVIDFISFDKDAWKMTLVEDCDWSGDISEHLYRIQNRLYECIDAALDGQLAEQFPESAGKEIIIQLDCYDAPQKELEEFFTAFSGQVMNLPDYKNALEHSEYISDIKFEINFDNTSEHEIIH